jgi:Tfp pilus assembly protein PilE
MTTVQWSLGFAAVFLLGFLGLIGFFSYQRAESDRKTVEASLRAQLAEAETRLTTQAQELHEGTMNRLSTESQQQTERLKSLADSAAKAAVAPAKYQITELREDLLRLRRELLAS